MSAKTTNLPGSVIVETVGTGLNISRSPMAGAPPTVAFNVNFQYADHTYLVDAEGAKIKLLQQGENTRFVGYTTQQSGEFYLLPMKTMDGKVTCLGEFLASAWDAAIQSDMAKTNPMMP